MTAPDATPGGAPALAAAFGGGGLFGIAYGLAVADALTQAGASFAGAEMIGTSAGAWVAAILATGVETREMPRVHVPDHTPGLLRGLASDLFGEAGSPQVVVSATRLPRARRVFLSGADHPLADIVAASSAVPLLFRPVRIGTTTYVDGGVRSLVSADHAARARQLLVVAPIAGPMFGPGGRAMEIMLRNELRRWERTTGGTAHLVRPNTRVASLARHPLQLFDKARAEQAYVLGHAQMQTLLAERAELAALARPQEDCA